MLEIAPFTTEDLRKSPFTAKTVEQLEQEVALKSLEKGKQEGSLKTKKDDIKSVILSSLGYCQKSLKKR